MDGDCSSNSVQGIYLEGEQLGNETRNKEFKKGGGKYLENVLEEDVSTYVCAFLNSGEEGTLYIGVNDSGCVEGTVCPHSREDRVRLSIDKAIKAIRPSVFPNAYVVKFTPVFYKLGVPKGDHKVIEIIVHGAGDSDRLYRSPHGTFLRRDGGVQSLRNTEEEEWLIQRHQREIRRLEERLKRQEDMFDKTQEEIYKHLEEIQRLQREKDMKTQEEKDKKSKFCVIL